MRLRDIKQLLDEINFSIGYLQKDANSLTNLKKFRHVIDQLNNTGLFQDETVRIYNSPIFTTPQDKMEFSSYATVDKLILDGNGILVSAEKLSDVISNLVPELSEFTISIKLPDTHDFNSIHSILKTLDLSFNQMVTNETINGYVQIENWEHGSFWVNITVGSLAAITIIGSAAWSAAVIAKKYHENKIIEKQVAILDLKKESIEDLLEKQKIATSNLIEMESRAVYDKNFTGEFNNDQFTRVQKSIEMLADLIYKGTEIHPSLTAPESVDNLFPDFNNLESITSKIEQIENKS